MKIAAIHYTDDEPASWIVEETVKALGFRPLELFRPCQADLVGRSGDVLIVEYAPKGQGSTPAEVRRWAEEAGIKHVIEVTEDTQ